MNTKDKTCHLIAQQEESTHEIQCQRRMKKADYRKCNNPHPFASRRNLQTYFQVLLNNCLFALNTFGKVCYIAKVTVTTEQQMRKIKHWTARKVHPTLQKNYNWTSVSKKIKEMGTAFAFYKCTSSPKAPHYKHHGVFIYSVQGAASSVQVKDF